MSRRRKVFFSDDNNDETSAFFNLAEYERKTSDGESISLFGEKQNNSRTQSSKLKNQHKPLRQDYDYSQSKRIRKKRSRRKVKSNRKSGVALIVVMAYAVVGFFVCSLMITRYSYICRVDDGLDILENEIEALESIVEEKSLQVSLKDDIGMVQTEAKTKLNMYYPKNEQIIYINLEEFETSEIDNGFDEEGTKEVLSEPAGALLE